MTPLRRVWYQHDCLFNPAIAPETRGDSSCFRPVFASPTKKTDTMTNPANTVSKPSRRRGVALAVAALTVAAFATVATGGCGPVQSTAGISEAEGSVERARIQDAGEYSPYEYERAQHYLYKAKEQWGYSNFEAARDYATEARRAADAALDNSLEAPWQGHPVYGMEDWPAEVEQLEQQLEEAEEIEAVDEVQDLEDPDEMPGEDADGVQQP